jgi:hypothetical protein
MTLAADEREKQTAARMLQWITSTAIAHAPPLPPSLPPPAAAVRVGGSINPPVKIRDVRAIYPDVAAAAEVQGRYL